MTLRHCARCGTEVEDAGGYCLLGHPLRLQPPIDSLTELRAEVDRAFDEAQSQVAEVLEKVPVSVASDVPSGARVTVPPPPPAARPDPFQALQHEQAPDNDPLTDFAPAPRMDWGPERSGVLRRRP